MEARAEELKLTIERGSDPIAGRIGLPGGQMLRFEGYVQLVAALESIRVSPPSEDPEEGGRG